MKHITRVSKQLPGRAAADDVLTGWGAFPGLPLPVGKGGAWVTFNEWGDWVDYAAGKVDNLNLFGINFGQYWTIQ